VSHAKAFQKEKALQVLPVLWWDYLNSKKKRQRMLSFGKDRMKNGHADPAEATPSWTQSSGHLGAKYSLRGISQAPSTSGF
jgi:hypothetical protein